MLFRSLQIYGLLRLCTYPQQRYQLYVQKGVFKLRFKNKGFSKGTLNKPSQIKHKGTVGHFVHSKVIETIANSSCKHQSSSKAPFLPSRSNKEASERFEEVCHSFTARRAWNSARRAQREINTGAQLSRGEPIYVHDTPILNSRLTRQSHSTAHLRGVFSFKRVAFVVMPPTAFKTFLTHKQRSAS